MLIGDQVDAGFAASGAMSSCHTVGRPLLGVVVAAEGDAIVGEGPGGDRHVLLGSVNVHRSDRLSSAMQVL